MPQHNPPAESLAQQYAQFNPVLVESMLSIRHLLGSVEANMEPVRIALAQLNPVLEQVSQDIRRGIFGSDVLESWSKILNVQLRGFQHEEISRTLVQIAGNLASATEAALGDIERPGAAPLEQFARIRAVDSDERKVLAALARAGEEALVSDPKNRKKIARSATRISQWTNVSVGDARTLLLALFWLFAVIVPLSDGKLKLDDFAAPAAATATVMVAAIDGNQGQRRNPLQKNGPRRRRHRRKR